MSRVRPDDQSTKRINKLLMITLSKILLAIDEQALMKWHSQGSLTVQLDILISQKSIIPVRKCARVNLASALFHRDLLLLPLFKSCAGWLKKCSGIQDE
ncbi:unnamed protein product [Nesidiocoris tenuis]|uniref:Uncharacterized protein n=1 Tax=Nesidiocoris tenuis TaxID=355587 RepID=A0A6H5GAQ5_9HEMI|nr:unnamed protein product [Nesidiocoris tenuis]